MQIADIMTSPVETTFPGAAAEAAREQMKRRGCHHLVVMEGGRIAGVLSERDLGGRTGAAARNRTVADLMSAPAVTARADTTLRRAANLMRGRALGCIVVVNERDKLAGILTISDLLEQIGRGSVRPTAESVRWTLRGRGPRHRVPPSRQV